MVTLASADENVRSGEMELDHRDDETPSPHPHAPLH